MDMFCCGMYRSCSTWQYDVAQAILKSELPSDIRPDVEACGYLTGPEYAEFSPATRNRGLIRLFKGHEGHPAYTLAMFKGRAFGLYAHRDPRDVIFSLMFKRQQSFQEILKTGMIHQILVNDRFWRLHPQVMVQRYDEIMVQPEAAIHEIAEYLGVSLPTDVAASIALAYSREANLKRTQDLKQKLADRGVNLDGSENAQVYDQKTLLHWNHIRVESCSWRELATPQEREVMQCMLGSWLAENNYSPDTFEDLQQKPQRPKAWRIDAAEGLLRCHSRETSSRYHRISAPIKQWLGVGAGERRSKPMSKVES